MKSEVINMITRDTTIGELVRDYPDAPEKLMRFGMMCVGCPSSQDETLMEAAAVHGMDLDALLKELNK
jgi:hybrid cluster-associated redox disulfide protein